MKSLYRIKRGREDKVFDTVVYVIGTIILLTVAYPLCYVLSASVSSPLEITSGRLWLLPRGFQTQAYMEVFKSSDILIGYRNTIVYAFVGTALNLLMTTVAAYPLSRPDLAGRSTLMLLITFTMFFSGGMIPTYITIQQLGMIDTFWVMIIPGAISVTNMIIMRNYFQHSVPPDIIEAAHMDGCSNVGILIRVVLPVSMPIIAVIVIFYFVSHWNAYFSALLYLNKREMYPLQVFLRQILIQNSLGDMAGTADSSGTMELALLFESIKYAVIIVASLPVLLLYPLMQRFFVKGIMMGSIKG